MEIDTQRNRVRATASGATALVDSAALRACSEEERRAAAAESLRCEPSELAVFELTRSLTAYERRRAAVSALRRVREIRDVRVVDERGVVRLALQDPVVDARDGRRGRKRAFARQSKTRPTSATSDARCRRFTCCAAAESPHSKDYPAPSKARRSRPKRPRDARPTSASRSSSSRAKPSLAAG